MKLNSIALKLPTAVAALCIVFSGALAYYGYFESHKMLLKSANERLVSNMDARARRLENLLEVIESELIVQSENPAVREAIGEFAAAWNFLPGDQTSYLQNNYITQNPHPTGEKDKLRSAQDGSRYSQVHAKYHPFFSHLSSNRGYHDVFLFDPDGNLVYSVFKELDYATNFVAGPWSSSDLGRVFRDAINGDGTAITLTDIAPYEPSANAPASFISRAIKDARGNNVGVLAFQIREDQISAALNSPEGMGETGEVFLVGPDLKRRSASRFSDGPSVLTSTPETPQLLAALAGGQGVLVDTTGANGARTVAAYRVFQYQAHKWAMLAEQNRDELLADSRALRTKLLVTIGLAALAILGVAFAAARYVTRPLGSLCDAIAKVAAGNFTDETPATARRDEVGDIARNLEKLREDMAVASAESRTKLFKSAAFDASSAAMMLVGRDLVVTDVNETTKALLSRSQEEVRKLSPDFDPDAIVGTCIDFIHRDLGVQSQILSDPSQLPYQTDIDVGNLKIALNISAILDEDGNYLGNIFEWDSVGEKRLNYGLIDAIRRSHTVAEFSLDGTLCDANKAYFDTYGYERSDLIGKSQAALEKLGIAPTVDAFARLADGEHTAGKFERRGRDGNSVHVNISLNPVLDIDGNSFKYVEIGTDITKTECERHNVQARNDRMEAAKKQVVESLRDGLRALAEGDLTQPIDQEFFEEYEQLRTDFNGTLEQLHDSVETLSENGGNIRNGASEISQAADDLSRRTENQASTLEQTAAALDQLTASVRSAADGATEADTAVSAAKSEAEASGEVVREAVSAMEEIQNSSDQISQIIGVIDDIAFQTNLLALNAGVEAARAGDAGRGFAVVASEVRALAQRSSEAAKEIKTLISTSSLQVERGVGLVGNAGDALHKIVDSVTEISALVSDIAASAKEQASGLSEINTGMNLLDQVTQQNAALVEQSTAASHNLRQEADNLGDVIARFRIADETVLPEPVFSSHSGGFERDTSVDEHEYLVNGSAQLAVPKNVESAEWTEF